MSAATDALRGWAAAWGLGGAVNALEVIEKHHGITSEPTHDAGLAILEALDALGLHTSRTEYSPDVWRDEP